MSLERRVPLVGQLVSIPVFLEGPRRWRVLSAERLGDMAQLTVEHAENRQRVFVTLHLGKRVA